MLQLTNYVITCAINRLVSLAGLLASMSLYCVCRSGTNRGSQSGHTALVSTVMRRSVASLCVQTALRIQRFAFDLLLLRLDFLGSTKADVRRGDVAQPFVVPLVIVACPERSPA